MAGFDPEWVLAIMAAESGLNARAGRGLTRMTPQALRAQGEDVNRFAELEAHEQLPIILEFFDRWRLRCQLANWPSGAQMYLVCFLPILLPLGGLPDYIVVDRLRAPAVYDANPDITGDIVTEAELDRTLARGRLQKRYLVALESLARVSKK